MKKVTSGEYNGFPVFEVETKYMDFVDFIKIPDKERPLVYVDGRIFFHVGGNQLIINDWKKAADEDSYLTFTEEKIEVITNALINRTDIGEMFFSGIDKYKSNKDPFKTYVIHDQSNNIYKIGKSRNPVNRIYNIERHNLSIITLLIIDLDVEDLLHAEYAKKKVDGEWFSLSEDDIIDIYTVYKDKIITDNR